MTDANAQYDATGAAVYIKQCDEANYATKCVIPTMCSVWNLPPLPSLRLLDFGCGTGTMTRFLKALTGATVVGLDISEAMITRAQELNVNSKQDIRYIQADCTNDLRGASELAALGPYDLVNGTWVWTNVKDYAQLKAMAANAYYLLRKGGRLCGLLNNPFLTRKDYSLYERYNILYSPEGTAERLSDGQILGVTVATSPSVPPMQLYDHFWTAPTIERACCEAGFIEFQFVPTPYVYQAESKEEAVFYQPLIEKPNFLIFTATK